MSRLPRALVLASIAFCLCSLPPAAGREAEAHSYAYVTDATEKVTILDLDAGTTRARIDIGPYMPSLVVVDRRGKRAYVSQCGTVTCDGDFPQPGSVSVIDTASASIVATVPVGRDPAGLAVNRAGTRVYVANPYDPVSVIDTANATVVGSLPVSGRLLALSRNDRRLYVGGFSRLSVVDLATNEVSELLGAFAPQALALDRAGKRIFVAERGNSNDGTARVRIVDAETLTEIATVPLAVDFDPLDLAVGRSGRFLYVAGHDQPQNASMVWVIDAKRATVAAVVPVPTVACGLALHPHKPHLYVTAYFNDDIMSVIDTRANAVVDEVHGAFSYKVAVGRGR